MQQSKLLQQSRAVGMAQLAGTEKMREAIRGLAQSGVSQMKEANRGTLGELQAKDTPAKQQANDNQAQTRQLGAEQQRSQGR